MQPEQRPPQPAATPPAPAQPAAPPAVTAFDHIVLTVADIDATVAFYTNVLGMRAESFIPAGGGAPRPALKFGRQKINLHPAAAPFAPHAARPLPGSADLCLLTGDPLPRWQAHLRERGITIEEGPVRRSGAAGAIESLYIRDPDGNLIEISTPLRP